MGQECSCQCGDDKGEMDYKEVSKFDSYNDIVLIQYKNIMQNNEIMNKELQARIEAHNNSMQHQGHH